MWDVYAQWLCMACDGLVQGTLKYGGGHVMLWGCFGWYGAGYTPKIDDTINPNLYVSILEDGFQKSLNYWDKNAQGMCYLYWHLRGCICNIR